MLPDFNSTLQPLDNRSGSEPYARQSAAGVGASFHAGTNNGKGAHDHA